MALASLLLYFLSDKNKFKDKLKMLWFFRKDQNQGENFMKN